MQDQSLLSLLGGEKFETLKEEEYSKFLSQTHPLYSQSLQRLVNKKNLSLEDVRLLSKIVFAVGITAIVPLGNFLFDLSKVIDFENADVQVLTELYELIQTVVESYFSHQKYEQEFILSPEERILSFVRKMIEFQHAMIKARDIDGDMGALIHPGLFDSLYMNYIDKKYQFWLKSRKLFSQIASKDVVVTDQDKLELYEELQNLIEEITNDIAKSQARLEGDELQEDQLQYVIELKSRLIRQCETLKQKLKIKELLAQKKNMAKSQRKSQVFCLETQSPLQKSPFQRTAIPSGKRKSIIRVQSNQNLVKSDDISSPQNKLLSPEKKKDSEEKVKEQQKEEVQVQQQVVQQKENQPEQTFQIDQIQNQENKQGWKSEKGISLQELEQQEQEKNFLIQQQQQVQQNAILESLEEQESSLQQDRDLDKEREDKGAGYMNVCCNSFFYYDEELNADEGINIEFKNYTWPWKPSDEYDCLFILKKTICAFLNTEGGVILIGINDQNTKVKGVTLSHKMQDDVILHFNQQVFSEFEPEILLDKRQAEVQFVPIMSGEGTWITKTWVIKIIIRQGIERDQLYTFSYKNEQIQSFVRYQGQNQKLNPAQLKKRIMQRSKEPVVFVKFHNCVDPDPNGTRECKKIQKLPVQKNTFLYADQNFDINSIYPPPQQNFNNHNPSNFNILDNLKPNKSNQNIPKRKNSTNSGDWIDVKDSKKNSQEIEDVESFFDDETENLFAQQFLEQQGTKNKKPNKLRKKSDQIMEENQKNNKETNKNENSPKIKQEIQTNKTEMKNNKNSNEIKTENTKKESTKESSSENNQKKNRKTSFDSDAPKKPIRKQSSQSSDLEELVDQTLTLNDDDLTVKQMKKRINRFGRKNKYALQISNIKYDLDKNQVLSALKGTGTIADFLLPHQQNNTTNNRGYAYVAFEKEEDYEKLLKLDNSIDLAGRMLKVETIKP